MDGGAPAELAGWRVIAAAARPSSTERPAPFALVDLFGEADRVCIAAQKPLADHWLVALGEHALSDAGFDDIAAFARAAGLTGEDHMILLAHPTNDEVRVTQRRLASLPRLVAREVACNNLAGDLMYQLALTDVELVDIIVNTPSGREVVRAPQFAPGGRVLYALHGIVGMNPSRPDVEVIAFAFETITGLVERYPDLVATGLDRIGATHPHLFMPRTPDMDIAASRMAWALHAVFDHEIGNSVAQFLHRHGRPHARRYAAADLQTAGLFVGDHIGVDLALWEHRVESAARADAAARPALDPPRDHLGH